MSKKLFSKVFILLLVVGLLFAVAPTRQAQAADIAVGPGQTYTTIQAAINAATAGDTITVAAGTYVEDVVVNKAITLQGAGMETTTIVATTGNTSPLTFNTSNATVSGFHITHNYTQAELDAWNFNNNGVTFYQNTTGNTLVNCKVTKSRNGIYINNARGNVLNGNTIENNRTGINITNYVDNTQILNNIIQNNWTIGIVYYQGSATLPTNFSTVTVTGNTFSNNWYSEILLKDNGSVVSTDTGVLNVTDNTFGDSPVTYSTSADPSLNEPGFADLKPVEFGGTATMPTTPLPTLRIYNVPGVTLQKDGKTLLVGGAPNFTTIQAAIDAAAAGDTIQVAAGTYTELLTITKPLTLLGPNAGIDGTTGTRNPEALITFPEGDNSEWSLIDAESSDITINGFSFTNNQIENTSSGGWDLILTGENIEFVNNRVISQAKRKIAFKIEGPFTGIYDPANNYGGAVVKNNYFESKNTSWSSVIMQGIGATVQYNTMIGGSNGIQIQPYSNTVGGLVSHNNVSGYIMSIWHNYQIGGNGLWIYEYNNVGAPIPPTTYYHYGVVGTWGGIRVQTDTPNIEVRNNTFNGENDDYTLDNGDLLERTSLGVYYYSGLYAASQINVHDNEFVNVDQNVDNQTAALGDLDIVFANNTFEKSAYIENGYLIYTSIQDAIDAAADGDTILVGPGTYAEAITLNKPNITVKSTDGAATTIIDVPAGSLTTGVKVLANMGIVTFDGFTVQNFTEGGIIQGMAAGTGTTFHVLNNVLLPFDGYLRNGIQVSGDGSTVVGNTITSAYLTSDWSSTAICVVDANNVIVSGNTISGVGNYGISAYTWNDATMSNIQILSNTITGIDYPLGVIAYNDGSIDNVDLHLNKVSGYEGAIEAESYHEVGYEAYWGTSVTDVDATHNWWGSPFGPQAPVYGEPQIIQWCADEGCTTFAPVGGKITLTSDDSQVGAIKIYVPGISYYLIPGTVLQNTSPCFEVYANDVTIYADYPAAAKCVPTNGSDGIWVADDVQNLRVVNLEFDGTGQTTGSGIFFAGDVVGFQVVDNYFHDLGASGVVFTGTPSGTTMDIQGNMFQDLGAEAIVVPTGLEPDLNAEFNSWGEYAGATLTDVGTEPHTHADFYMGYEGVIPLEKVAVGNTIKYTVYGNLQNITGAQFTLKFPTDLLDAGTPVNKSAFQSAGDVPLFVVDETAGTITFNGYASTAITGQDLPIYEVVFTGTAAGTGAISFDQTNDAFAMFPGYGPSTWVYAAGYVDRTVEVFLDETAPTLETWTPDEGDIYLAEGEDFVLTVNALDDNLFSLEIDHNVTTLPEFTVYAFASNVYGSPEAQAEFLTAGVTVTYDETTQTWVITFDSAGTALAQLLAKKDVTFYAVLHDQAGKTWGSMYDLEEFNTFAYSIVFDNTSPALDSWTPVEDMTYMLTPSGDFVVTVDANDVNLYELEIDNSLEPGLPQFSVYADETDPYGGDGALFGAAGLVVTYDPSTQTWVLTFENGGDALDAIIANQGITFYAVIHDLAGNTWGSMYDVEEFNTFAYTLYQQKPIARADSTGGDVVAVVSADGNTIDFTGEVDWYPADPDLGRTSGHRIGVKLSAPELDFGTADTTFTFNGQTYDWDIVKDGDDYVLVYPKVTSTTQSWVIVVTWGGGFSQTFTVNFNGILGPVTAYTVEGEISMQGRVARNTDDVITLTGYGTDIFTADSLDKLGINYTLANVLTGEYTITTNQPRYLNIYCDEDPDPLKYFCKKITVIGDRTLPVLWLRGGNAIWTDNEITLDDANKVGTDWGSIADPDGNVNFDGIVNIQDLALVGGNYGLDSAEAYGSWLTP